MCTIVFLTRLFLLKWFLFVSCSKVTQTTASDVGSGVRHPRAVENQVQPVDCVLSEWSAWSRCDVCQKKRVSMTRDHVEKICIGVC